MSAATSPRPQTTATTPIREEGATRRPVLRLIDGGAARSLFSGRAVAAALIAIGGVFAIQLFLSMALIQGAYTEDALTGQHIELQREHTAALEDVNSIASPQHLAEMATAVGMVPQANPNVLDLETGTIVEGTGGQGAVAGAPLNTSLVPNSITNGQRDAAEQQKLEQFGASHPSATKSDVSSEFELQAPKTR